MQKDFDDCLKKGGKVRTKNLKGNKFIRICYDKRGKAHVSEVTSIKRRHKQKKFEKKVKDKKTLEVSLLQLKGYYNDNYHN